MDTYIDDISNELTRACYITQPLDLIDPVFSQITHTVQINGKNPEIISEHEAIKQSDQLN